MTRNVVILQGGKDLRNVTEKVSGIQTHLQEKREQHRIKSYENPGDSEHIYTSDELGNVIEETSESMSPIMGCHETDIDNFIFAAKTLARCDNSMEVSPGDYKTSTRPVVDYLDDIRYYLSEMERPSEDPPSQARHILIHTAAFLQAMIDEGHTSYMEANPRDS